MDEGTLNDLLECSVCLDRLDTSSKVLPCQHTFCTKCLQEIVDSRKELKCPECRVLVPCKVEDLPPNVLLMRILEGMKNAIPKKHQRMVHQQHHQPHLMQHQHHANFQQIADRRHKSNKQQQPQISPQHSYAKALYDYLSNEPTDLSFKQGDTIIIQKRIDDNWLKGESNGKQGIFPLSYVQIITPVPSHIPQCKALYDFRMSNDEEEGCLSFRKGDVLTVIRRVDENWAEGKLDGKIGIFPLPFVELNNLARSLMKLSSNSQPGPSRLAPPTPTNEDTLATTSPAIIPTDHTHTLLMGNTVHTTTVGNSVSSATVPVTAQLSGNNTVVTATATAGDATSARLATSDSSGTLSSGGGGGAISTTTSTSNTSSSSLSSTAPSSPASPPPRRENTKRHSFTNSPSSGMTTIHQPLTYIALFPYKPQKADELELRKGGVYLVTERCQDGWFKGTSNRTQKCGVFPGNYVTLARGNASGAVLPTPPPLQQPPLRDALQQVQQRSPISSKSTTTPTRGGINSSLPPELPPRSASPITPPSQEKPIAKVRERSKDKSSVSLMRRLASMKRSKSPPAESCTPSPGSSGGLLDVQTAAAVHVRSGSCPSQLLQQQQQQQQQQAPPAEQQPHRAFFSAAASSQRVKHRERPTILGDNNTVKIRSFEEPAISHHTPIYPSHGGPAIAHRHAPSSTNPHHHTTSTPQHHHRKSQSLDATTNAIPSPYNVITPLASVPAVTSSTATVATSSSGTSHPRTGTQTVRERYRCIAPYPPNSEYELELRVNDVIFVHKKRDDGWFKGTQPRTGRTGLFPASFVEGHP